MSPNVRDPQPRPGELGALVQWWREVSRGQRTAYGPLDTLHLAAAWEAAGRDAEQAGDDGGAAWYREKAADVIRAAARARTRRVA